MQTWCLLLRGVNVGGHGRLPMADLRTLLAGLGAKDVATYIQSGNAVFRGAVDPVAFTAAVRDGIEAAQGFRPAAFLLPGDRVRAIRDAFPFPEAFAAPKTGHVWFLTGAVKSDLAALEALATADEQFALIDGAFCLHAPDGIGRSKLAARVEALLGVPATARNLNTLGKLCDLLEGLK
ncbi:DUF1697 domain-containing protein [Aliiroseovarius subalbicans]|uniref:DUF1697 domain-containing protein n=1 Tax=Aliiroseovarius subalbicans TaxID=2925840 RepID=UPI001F57DF93|nr:DUF1697 domain-containing protein [Aliiroseovarius subalbicans]MCI2398766.1 DUF1697 domain-containing protein [Aliiroseovarius subalbicans]